MAPCLPTPMESFALGSSFSCPCRASQCRPSVSTVRPPVEDELPYWTPSPLLSHNFGVSTHDVIFQLHKRTGGTSFSTMKQTSPTTVTNGRETVPSEIDAQGLRAAGLMLEYDIGHTSDRKNQSVRLKVRIPRRSRRQGVF